MTGTDVPVSVAGRSATFTTASKAVPVKGAGLSGIATWLLSRKTLFPTAYSRPESLVQALDAVKTTLAPAHAGNA